MSTDPRSRGGPVVIDGISYIPSTALQTGIRKLSFKDDLAFGVLDSRGEAPRIYSQSELGVYFKDTRYLSLWEMMIHGHPPTFLSQELRHGGRTIIVSMSNPDLQVSSVRIPRGTLLLRRVLTLDHDTLFETIDIKNFSNDEFSLDFEFWAGSEFEDIFEVRGFSRIKRGELLDPLFSSDAALTQSVFQYRGLDQLLRQVCIQRLFGAEWIETLPQRGACRVAVKIPKKGTVTLKSIVSFDQVAVPLFKNHGFAEIDLSEKMQLLSDESVNSPFSLLQFDSDNAIFDRAIRVAKTDLEMLLTREEGGEEYPYAGIPWFSAPFGRDGLVTAYQLLPWFPNFARGVLEYVFRHLGQRENTFTEEQPGRVFHEFRRGEMARNREVPYIPYFGTVDATPLALILLHEYVKWTGDRASLTRWWPKALQAMDWIQTWGDSDRDGFIEYQRMSETGLQNQGWKDSHDSVMHQDGTLASAPIRLCEVQAYAYRALWGMAQLSRLQGMSDLSDRFRVRALELKAHFAQFFWDPVKGSVHLALDGNRKPCRVRSSNMGHCLWTQILPPEAAEQVAAHLMSREMFSGYGIRTLANDEVLYNPMSYHNGSIWPHDNSLIMEGFRNYGLLAGLQTQADAFLSVIEATDDFRLPELFCGFRRRGDIPPVPYEVACKPQAWAAGALFLMMKSMLGISKELDQNYLVLNSPLLPASMDVLEIRGLRAGPEGELDLRIWRTQSGTRVETLRKTGDVRVLTVR